MKALLEWLSNSGAAVLVSSLLSIGAIILSLLAHRTSRKALRIEEARERDRVTLSRRAVLVASIMTEDRDAVGTAARMGVGIMRWNYLVVENPGDAEAREIEVVLDGKPFRNHPVAPKDHQDVRRVGEKSFFRYRLQIRHETKPPFDLELTWQDDSGEPGRYRTTLTY
jgi:hypothetical protein